MNMPLSEAKYKSNSKWIANNYMRINIALPKELGEEFKELCKMTDVSVNGLIRGWIEEYIASSKTE